MATRLAVLAGVLAWHAPPPAYAVLGDCDCSGAVGISDLITGVNVALGNAPMTTCAAIDANENQQASIDELIAAVNAALNETALADPVPAYSGFGANQGGYAQRQGPSAYCVTSTRDYLSNAAAVPGTLRYGVEVANAKYIRFSVSGDIVLDRAIRIVNQSNVTLSGFGAPKPVTLKPIERRCVDAPAIVCDDNDDCGGPDKICNKPTGIVIGTGATNVVVNDVRVRGALDDGIRVDNGAQTVVLDHVSVTGSGDGNIDVVNAGTRNVTVSRSFLGQPPDGDPNHVSKNTLIADGSSRVTMHDNVFLGAEQRSPLASFALFSSGMATCTAPDTSLTLDLVNNLIWGWTGYGTKIRLGAKANVQANYYGSSTRSVLTCSRNCPNAVTSGADCDADDKRSAISVSVMSNVNRGNSTVSDAGALMPANSGLAVQDPTIAACAAKSSAGARPRDATDTGMINGIALVCS